MKFSRFATRQQAGAQLAKELTRRRYQRPLVLALPRGGVPIGAEVARALNAPLDLLLVRKIGVPWQRELAAAAIVDGEKHDSSTTTKSWRRASWALPISNRRSPKP